MQRKAIVVSADGLSRVVQTAPWEEQYVGDARDDQCDLTRIVQEL